MTQKLPELPYKDSPKRYIREHLKKWLSPKQEEVCDKIVTYPYRVLMPSANNQGKSFLAAALANWMYDCHNPSETLVTAVTREQVRNGIFKEIRNIRGADSKFAPSANWLYDSQNHYIRGFTARNPDAFQGSHGFSQAIFFDESTGIDELFWKRAKTMHQMEPGHYWLAGYNPNDSTSYVATIEDDSDWHVVRFNALEHPNILAQLQRLPLPVPSAITLTVVWARMQKECKLVEHDQIDLDTDFNFPVNSDYWWRPLTIEFEAQILGRWPLIPTSSLLSLRQLNYFGEQVSRYDERQQLVISCDVARFGTDKTCVLIRRGLTILELITLEKRDGREIAETIKSLLYKYILSHEKAYEIPIIVDGTGGYGGTVQDSLPEYKVYAVSMSSTSPHPMYKKMRSYLWFMLMEVILQRGWSTQHIPQHLIDLMKRDLVAPRYRIDEMGRKYLEPKTETKRRRGHSPDIGDTCALSMYELVLSA